MADDASPNLSREPATVRIAMWSARHRWPVFAGWFIATIGLFVLSQSIGGIKADDPNGNPNQAQTESAKAYTVFDAGGNNTPTEDVTIVVTHPSLKVTDPAYQTFVAGIVTRLKGLTVSENGATVPVFDEVQDPATAPPTSGLVSQRPVDRPGQRPDHRRSGRPSSVTSCRSATRSPRSSPTARASRSTRSARR